MRRDSFTQQLDLGHELIIDNFAGGGGTSEGLEQAFGRPVDIAINHNPEALAMHAINHPKTLHLCESVWNVHPLKVTHNRPVGLVWLSPDCFPAGTMVMTDKGYRAIETIRVGDQVLTHKLRWRAVTECSSAVRPLIEIRGHGHPGLRVSPEHPFYTREQYRTWNNDRRSYDYALKGPEWTPASAVQKGLYWGAPCSFPESVAPHVTGRGIDMSNELLWLAGRYVGDGWTRLTDARSEVVITCGKHEVERLRGLLNRWPRSGNRAAANELEWHERHTSTAYQFTTHHRGLVEWLREHFGHRAEAKGIPAWALGLPVEARESLLEGYLSADGHKFDDFVEAHTVSKSLAFGLKALANSLGKTVSVNCRPNSTVIQGREVNARDLFKVRWRHAVHADHAQTYIEDGIEWCPVREQSAVSESADVFNIGVEEDESYVVEGVIVHNCKHFSKAKGGTPVDKAIRGLAWVGLRWAAMCKPRVMMLENVEEFQDWGPLIRVERDGEMVWMPDPAKRGKTFESFVRQLRGLGYEVDWRELRACDNGAPTIRKRLFLVARRDGLPIRFPDQSHAVPTDRRVLAGKLQPYRTAAECINWSIEGTSIFGRKRPLATNTQRRVAKGLWRHVLTSAAPYIVTNTSGHSGTGIDAPLPTITTGGHHMLAQPMLTPFLTEHANSSTQRTMAANEPLRTVCAQVKGGHFSMVAPTLTPLRGTSEAHLGAHRIDRPMSTVSAGGTHHALTGAHLITIGYGERPGQDARTQSVQAPVNTITAGGVKQGLVAAHLVDMGHGEGQCGTKRFSHGVRSLDAPLNTITASGATAGLAVAFMEQANGGFYEGDGRRMDEPISTITAAGSNQRLVTAYCIKYYSSGGQDQPVGVPMHTLPTKGRMGLVQVTKVPADGLTDDQLERARQCADLMREHLAEQFTEHADIVLMQYQGQLWVLVDITLRMLKPRELFLAQGFPESYVIHEIPDPDKLFKDGVQAADPLQIPRIPLTATAQVRMCGNSVSPYQARALALANFAHESLIYNTQAA